MSEIAFVASVVVGVTLLVAGGTKLASGQRWPVEARALGAPGVVIPLLPWIEIALGALLVVRVAEPFAALGAIVLFASFTVLIALRLAQGSRPPCACFGAWSARPLGPGHLVRNAVLIALALLALW